MKKEISQLKKYLDKREDIIAAFLFGSRAKGIAGRISDWDIGVYFKPHKAGEIEWEDTDKRYPQENMVWDDLVDICKTDDVDLVVLNRAPSNIAASAISEGISISNIKDRKTFLDFMLLTMRQAEDYAHFVDEFYEISQRSASLTSRDRETLRKIIDFLEQEVTSCSYFSVFSFIDYQDIHKRREIERWVENMVNSAIDIGEIILASEKQRIPNYYKDIFVQLGFLPQFKSMDVKKFTEWVKLRNILAHEYLDIKWQRIEDFVRNCDVHFKHFLESAKKFIK